MELIQENKTVLQYEAKFTELARFAPHFVSNDVRKAKKFQRGLDQVSKLGCQLYD